MQALKSPEALFISVPLSVQKQSVVQQVSRANHNMKQNTHFQNLPKTSKRYKTRNNLLFVEDLFLYRAGCIIQVVDSRICSLKTITTFPSFLGNEICKLFKIHVTRNSTKGIPLQNIKKSQNFPVVCHLDFRVEGHFALSALSCGQVSYELLK